MQLRGEKLKEYQKLTCKWLFTSSLVRPSTCMSSLICFGVAAAVKTVN
jgi:hypothetical protein